MNTYVREKISYVTDKKKFKKYVLPKVRVIKDDIGRTDLLKQASAMAYVTLLSIIPSLAAIISIITIFKPLLSPETDLVGMIRDFLLTHLAKGSGEQVASTLDNLISGLNFTQIGVSSVIGLLISLVLLLRQIENALNRIWHVEKGRNVVTRFVYFWTLLTLGTFLGSLALGYLSKMGITNALNLDGSKSILSQIVETLYGYASGYIIFLFLFKAVPNIHVPFKYASIGALTATFLLDQAGSAFTFYVSSFSSHKAVYGALAALPLFLTWLYICWLVILFGALISWRSAQGFKDAENDHYLLQPQSPEEFYSAKRTESLVPLFCMLKISKHFWKKAPEAITVGELEEKLDIPLPWIYKALGFLEKSGFVKAISSDDKDKSYVPGVPLEKLTLSDLSNKFKISTMDQLNDSKQYIEKAAVELGSNFYTCLEKSPDMSLSEFVKTLK